MNYTDFLKMIPEAVLCRTIIAFVADFASAKAPPAQVDEPTGKRNVLRPDSSMLAATEAGKCIRRYVYLDLDQCHEGYPRPPGRQSSLSRAVPGLRKWERGEFYMLLTSTL